jgi:hypothetical protein
LVGFVIGIAAFILLFLLLKARLSVVRSGLGALAFVLFFGSFVRPAHTSIPDWPPARRCGR